jgi:hypothetical protein
MRCCACGHDAFTNISISVACSKFKHEFGSKSTITSNDTFAEIAGSNSRELCCRLRVNYFFADSIAFTMKSFLKARTSCHSCKFTRQESKATFDKISEHPSPQWQAGHETCTFRLTRLRCVKPPYIRFRFTDAQFQLQPHSCRRRCCDSATATTHLSHTRTSDAVVC